MSTKKRDKFLKTLPQNYWAISTVVLAIVAIILAAVLISGGTSGIVSAQEAGQNVIDFASAQEAEATLVSTNDTGSLYEIILEIQGQEVPIYVTKDGKNMVPPQYLISLSEQETTTQTQETQSTPTPTNIPKSTKPVVEAFVMSHCPYGTQIEKGLLPVVNALGDKIDFEIKFVYYAMHPTYGEVEEQLNQYCIQSEQNDKYIDYLTCFLGAGDGAGCIEEVGIDTDALATCVEATDKKFNVIANLEDTDSWLSGRYPKFDIYKADNEKYQVGGSPTLVINGATAQVGRDSISLLNAICSSFEEAPEECNTQFEAVSPTAGFGWSTTENTNNAAACGA